MPRRVDEVGVLTPLLLTFGVEFLSHLTEFLWVGLDGLQQLVALTLEVGRGGVINLRQEGHLLLVALVHHAGGLGRVDHGCEHRVQLEVGLHVRLHVLPRLEHALLHHQIVHHPLCLHGVLDVRGRRQILLHLVRPRSWVHVQALLLVVLGVLVDVGCVLVDGGFQVGLVAGHRIRLNLWFDDLFPECWIRDESLCV